MSICKLYILNCMTCYIPDSAMPSSSSNASLSCISSGCLWSYSFPSRTARRHWKKRLNIVFVWGEHFIVTWWMQMYCCSVWTIQTLSFLISYTIPKMSTTSNFLIPCRILSMAIIVPDRPTPALQWATIGLCSGLTRSLNALTNLKRAHYNQQSRTKHHNPHLTRVWGGSGTPKSGQVVKWKCLMVLTVSPRIIRNSLMSQSG